jgi:MFS family permease
MHVAPAPPAYNDVPLDSRRLARTSLILLLAINLFNYIDRQILAAVEQDIAREYDANLAQMGRLVFGFLISYMLFSPVFGLLADRFRRWLIVGVGVILWSLASGGSGLAYGYTFLLLMRCLIGVGEAAYGPVAPTIIADLYPVETRGKVLAWFYAAIPVGSALGYTLGGLFVKYSSWHWAFFVTLPPGILLGLWCFFMPEPKRRLLTNDGKPHKATGRDYLSLLRNKSYVLNCLGMTAMTFAIGGIAFWMPRYLVSDRGLDPGKSNMMFGAIVALAGITATLAGGWAGDKLRPRIAGSYMLVSAAGLLAGFPMFLLMLVTPFPACWIVIFATCFCLFFNTGPSNTALANVTHPSIRATAFAVNIFVIHALGDAISPGIIGMVADRVRYRGANLQSVEIGFASGVPVPMLEYGSGLPAGFLLVSGMMLLGGVFWLWAARHLAADTTKVEGAPQT